MSGATGPRCAVLRAADDGSPGAPERGAAQPWGRLTWFASAALGNADQLTIGRCVLLPGMANPRHSHPNCAEVLVVIQGRIAHTVAPGEDVELRAGDTITIPARLPHRALNIGDGDAVLMLAFTSADRQVVGE